MRRTAMAAAGLVLVLAGTDAAVPHAQAIRAGGDSVEEFRAFVRESQDALRALAGETGGFAAAIEFPNQQDGELPHGGGIIRGTVTAAASGAPVGGAAVRAILATANASPVTAATDENGAFEFRGLTPGRWRISASRSGFLPREFGQRGRTGQGSSIELKDRGQVNASIALLRGGAIAGHVFDEFGDPAVSVRVQVMQFTRVENGRRLVPAGVPDVTDDTGGFRVYNLPPGDYLVLARALSPFDRGAIRLASGQTEFVVSQPGGVTFSDPPRPSLPTYFPGTVEIDGAATITLDPGSERTGIDFALTRVAPVRVSGTVMDSSGQIVSRPILVSLSSDAVDTGTMFMLSRPLNAGGVFDFPEVPPGSYAVTVNLAGGNGRPEFAEVPITVGAEDITGLQVVTAPGVSLTGTVVFDEGVRQSTKGMIVAASSVTGRRMAASPSTSAAIIDDSFQIPNLIGTYRFDLQRVPAGWSVKSIAIDGVDVTDTPVTVKSGRPHATIVLTNRLTDFSGTVTSAGKPIDADVLIFPDDPAKWTAWRFVRSLRADAQGMFSVRGMPPHHDYLALATTYLDPDDVLNPDFLALARARATPFSLAEGQSQRLRLTLVDRSELDGR